MSASKFIVMTILLVCLNASAQTSTKISSDVETPLKPFTAETNYMSLPGYFRHQYYLETGERLPTEQFQFGYNDTHIAQIKRSNSTIAVDFGSCGQIGDFVNYMDSKAISIIAKSIKIFPKLQRYEVSWSFYSSVGEGEYTSYYELGVVYDRDKKTLDGIGPTEYEVTDAEIFGMARQNKE